MVDHPSGKALDRAWLAAAPAASTADCFAPSARRAPSRCTRGGGRRRGRGTRERAPIVGPLLAEAVGCDSANTGTKSNFRVNALARPGGVRLSAT